MYWAVSRAAVLAHRYCWQTSHQCQVVRHVLEGTIFQDVPKAYFNLVKSDITGFNATLMYWEQYRVRTLHLDNMSNWPPSTLKQNVF